MMGNMGPLYFVWLEKSLVFELVCLGFLGWGVSGRGGVVIRGYKKAPLF